MIRLFHAHVFKFIAKKNISNILSLIVEGGQIRSARKARALTQADLADAVGVSQALISKIERGAAAPSSAVARKIAAALEIAVEQTSPSPAIEPPEAEPPWRTAVFSRLPRPMVLKRWHRPAQGGDFFVAHGFHDGSALIGAVDVIGHGPSALPPAAFLQGWLHGWARGHERAPRLEQLVADLTQIMKAADVDAAWFLAVVGAEGGTYEAITSGYPVPLLFFGDLVRAGANDAGRVTVPRSSAFLRAVLPLRWRLVLASDGLLKRLGAGREDLGKRSLITWQRGPRRDEPLEEYLGHAPLLADDESCALLTVEPWDDEIRFDGADATAVVRALHWLEIEAVAAIGDERAAKLRHAAAEAIDNAVVRGYSGAGGQVVLRFAEAGIEYRVEVEDAGRGGVIKEDAGYEVMRSKVDSVDTRRAYPRGIVVTLICRREASDAT